MWQALVGFPTLPQRTAFLVTSKVRFVYLWLDHYTSQDSTVTIYTPVETPVNDDTVPGSSAMTHGVVTGYGVPVNS